MLKQHGSTRSTRSSRLAWHVERVESCRDVTCRAKWNLGLYVYDTIFPVGLLCIQRFRFIVININIIVNSCCCDLSYREHLKWHLFDTAITAGQQRFSNYYMLFYCKRRFYNFSPWRWYASKSRYYCWLFDITPASLITAAILWQQKHVELAQTIKLLWMRRNLTIQLPNSASVSIAQCTECDTKYFAIVCYK